jgi:hypothetical protein
MAADVVDRAAAALIRWSKLELIEHAPVNAQMADEIARAVVEGAIEWFPPECSLAGSERLSSPPSSCHSFDG